MRPPGRKKRPPRPRPRRTTKNPPRPPPCTPIPPPPPPPADTDVAAAALAGVAGDEDELEGPPAGPGEAIVIIPDFSGLSVAQALSAAHQSGVKLEIEGTGRGVRQFPPPGRAMKSITC